MEEDAIINVYLTRNELLNLPLQKSAAFQVAKQVISDFNINEPTFKVMRMNNRPFLREDAGQLLTCREGLCGEGARVIIRLLHTLGFDATRITLYDKFVQTAHTLVSVKVGEEFFWVNSINSPDSVTRMLEEFNMSARYFFFLNYDDNVESRREKLNSHLAGSNEDERVRKVFDEYVLYSFEATPYTKIATKLGFNLRIFNLNRPPKFISELAEEPNMIKFYFYIFSSLLLTIIIFNIKLLRKYLQ